MKSSIRTFLLINLLLSVTLIISLAIIGNLFLAHKDIEIQLDAQLIHTTLRLQALFTDYTKHKRDLSAVQKAVLLPLSQTLKQYPHILHPQSLRQKQELAAIKSTDKYLEFQIWNKNGQLILHSARTPNIPLSTGKNGLSHVWLNQNAWRVNTLVDRNSQLTFMVAERTDYRHRLETSLTKDSILIMLITYPFLGLLIWIIVGRGLDALRRVANEVRNRAPTYLQPVDTASAPLEIKPLVNALNLLFTELREAFEREKRFTADAAHELRTPLAALNTHTQIALRAKTPDERKQALFKVLASVNRGTHVIQQLLTLHRMTPQALQSDAKPFNLYRETADVAAQLAPEAIAKNIEFELISTSEEIIVHGHATAIGILLRNLIDNAIRYSEGRGPVIIQLLEKTDEVDIHVIDNGPGIPESLRNRVFERFYRVMGTKATGSGLGLGIVLQIAHLHNASIELNTPESGNGLDFKVTLPKHQSFT